MTPVVRALRAGGAACSRGVTLVELMVAVVIGLLLTVVIAQLFLGSRQSFTTTDDLSRMQENIRYSQMVLIRTIHMAGYKTKPNSVTSAIFDGGGNPAVIGSNNAGWNGTDDVTVRFQGSGTAPGAAAADGTIQDCLGNSVGAGVMRSNTFSIQLVGGVPALGCSVDGGAWVELVRNVENMQIVYGEDTDSDLVANRLVRADQVSNWANVVGVRIALLYQTPGALTKGAVGSSTYDLNGANGVIVTINDQRIRRAVTTSINLRNRTP